MVILYVVKDNSKSRKKVVNKNLKSLHLGKKQWFAVPAKLIHNTLYKLDYYYYYYYYYLLLLLWNGSD